MFMSWIEEEYVFIEGSGFLPYLKTWKRYRDDVYILWIRSFRLFFLAVELKHSRIEFTIEQEVARVLQIAQQTYH